MKWASSHAWCLLDPSHIWRDAGEHLDILQWLRTPGGHPRTPAITTVLEAALGRPGWAGSRCVDARALVERVRRFSFGVID